MHYYSDCGCWAARGRAAQKGRVGRASLKGGDSDAPATREEDGSSPASLGAGGAGSGGAEVRLLRLGRAE
jgi:hypothetical protein